MFQNPASKKFSKNDSHSKSPDKDKASKVSFNFSSVQKTPKRIILTQISSNSTCTFFNCEGELYSIGGKKSGMLGFEEIGKLTNTPLRVRLPPSCVKIMKVSCSDTHILALDKYGGVYGWGVNLNCVLGVKQNLERKNEKIVIPEKVEILKKMKVVDIEVCNNCSFVTNFRGAAFMWGK